MVFASNSACKLIFSFDPLEILAEGTLKQAWERHAATLGGDPAEAVTFKADGVLVSPDCPCEAGREYYVMPKHTKLG